VVSFKLEDPNVGNEEKKQTKKEAKTYYKLATKYAITL